MLVDSGQTGYAVLETLRQEGISRIDYMVSTHYDSDHIGGIDRIIAGEDWEYGTADDIEVGLAIDRGNDSMGSSGYIDDYLNALDASGTSRHAPGIGETIDLGDGTEALCVCRDGYVLGREERSWDLSGNGRSVGYLINFGTFDFLVCGDLTYDTETLLAPGLYDKEIDVLHLNHHGSYSSTGWEFVEAVWPENAVVSVGSSNSYGHPHQEVLDNLNWIDGPNGDPWFQNTYMTERGSGNNTADNLKVVHGNIDIITDGSEYTLAGDTYPTDELDSDGDGMPDIWETHVGLNKDSSPDAGEDRDRDGLTEAGEWEWWTNPFSDDTEGDGMPDGWEVDHGLDPWVNDARRDGDGDGLKNSYEYEIGTNPTSKDSDGDGMPDNWEDRWGTDPREIDSSDDHDNDELDNRGECDHDTDPFNSDTDGDGMPDGWEVCYGLDPLSPDDAAGDADQDSVTNLDEYLNGTEPCRPVPTKDDDDDTGDNDDDDDTGDDDDAADDDDTDDDEPGDDDAPSNTTGNEGTTSGSGTSLRTYIIIGIIVLISLGFLFLFIKGGKNEE